MNFNDRELGMLFGDLDENELQGALSAMPAADKASFLSLKETLGELKSLRDEVPPLQLSPERVKDAIHAAPAKRACAWWASRWAWGGLASAACMAALFVMANQNAPSNSVTSGDPVVAHSSVAPPSPAVTPNENPEKSGSNLVAAAGQPSGGAIESPSVSVRVTSPKATVKKAPRTRYGNSYASSLGKRRESLRNTAEAPMIRTTSVPGGTAASGGGGAMATAIMDAGGQGVSGDEAVVVVTSDLDAGTGANHAVEVSVKQNDVVLGS